METPVSGLGFREITVFSLENVVGNSKHLGNWTPTFIPAT